MGIMQWFNKHINPSPIGGGAKRAFARWGEAILPRTCPICGRRLAATEEVFCTTCSLHLPYTDFLDNPYENEMAKVFWGRVKHFEKAFALLYHLPHADSARPIYQLKYFDKPDLGIEIGEMMGRMMTGKGFFGDIDCILPVPLAKSRLRKRGYNQSEMIGEGLRSVTRLPLLINVVKRVSFASTQTRKNRMERNENVEHVFELTDGDPIKGKHILIVDDVVTTGATICSLAKELEKVDDVRISVVSIGYAGEWRFVKQ